jgi:Uma2 family endonuclease
MSPSKTKFSLQEFLAMPESGDRMELIDGEIVSKVSPTSPHSLAQKRLLIRLNDWCEETNLGEVNPEWTVTLKRNGMDWAPVPDLTYISYERVPADWDELGPCPGIPQLVVEIISPGQTFSGMTSKATDYLLAGIKSVWVVEPQNRSVTIFHAGELPQIITDDGIISDLLLPGLAISLSDIFAPRRNL